MFKNILSQFSKKKTSDTSSSKTIDNNHYLDKLFKAIGTYPKGDVYLYEAALTHSSYNHSMRIVCERLELLGDAVISLAVVEMLYSKFPKKDEGFLTKARSKLVSREHLNGLALELGLLKYVHHTLDDKQLQNMPNLSGNCFEALMGAYFLDYGYKDTTTIIIKLLEDYADIGDHIDQESDYKSALYHYAQARNMHLRFDTQKTFDNGSSSEFECIIYSQNEILGKGKGKNKKTAEQAAAKVAMEQKFRP